MNQKYAKKFETAKGLLIEILAPLIRRIVSKKNGVNRAKKVLIQFEATRVSELRLNDFEAVYNALLKEAKKK